MDVELTGTRSESCLIEEVLFSDPPAISSRKTTPAITSHSTAPGEPARHDGRHPVRGRAQTAAAAAGFSEGSEETDMSSLVRPFAVERFDSTSVGRLTGSEWCNAVVSGATL